MIVPAMLIGPVAEDIQVASVVSKTSDVPLFLASLAVRRPSPQPAQATGSTHVEQLLVRTVHIFSPFPCLQERVAEQLYALR